MRNIWLVLFYMSLKNGLIRTGQEAALWTGETTASSAIRCTSPASWHTCRQQIRKQAEGLAGSNNLSSCLLVYFCERSTNDSLLPVCVSVSIIRMGSFLQVIMNSVKKGCLTSCLQLCTPAVQATHGTWGPGRGQPISWSQVSVGLVHSGISLTRWLTPCWVSQS